MKDVTKREIEAAIHSYCPLWMKWAQMIEQRQALDPSFPKVKEDAIQGLKKTVSRINKAVLKEAKEKS